MFIKPLFITTAIMFGGYALIGCGSGQQRRTETVNSSAAISVDALKAKQDLDVVVSGLKGLRDASDSADLNKMHDELKDNHEQLGDSLDTVIESSQEAVIAGTAQQDAWHKQSEGFSEADLRNASFQREGNLRTTVDELNAATKVLTAEWTSYRSLMQQTLGALDLDMTQQGLKTIKPTVEKLIERESNLRQTLTEVADKGNSMNRAISQ